MTSKQLRVSPDKNGDRRVHKPWATRDSAHTETKQEAIETARQIAKNQWLEMLVQNLDGKIWFRNSYGNDPFPPEN